MYLKMFQNLPLISNPLNDGGPLFMYTNLIILITIIVFLVKAFISQENNLKAINLVKHLSLFALVWGFLGQMLGLIGAFDAIEISGNVPPHILAAGLKIALLSPTFGMVIFLIARLGLVALTFLKK